MLTNCVGESQMRKWLLICLVFSVLTVTLLLIPSVTEQFRQPTAQTEESVSHRPIKQHTTTAAVGTTTGVTTQPPKEEGGQNTAEEYQHPSFKKDMQSFPWEEYKSAARTGNTDNTDKYSQLLISKLIPYLVEPPLVPIDETCKPDPLPPVDQIDCGKYPVFNGRRDSPVKVAHMVQIGFDVDILEIHLNELYDVVDNFFIIESTTTHYHKLKKPLMWEQVMYQDRFAKFQDKVVHLILDDSDQEMANDVFSAEGYQENRRWQKFVEWNKHHNKYGDNDIIGFGDTDEIGFRNNLHMLRHCKLQDHVGKLDIGIWFPFGPINQVFRPDWPVPNNPYTLGDPTYFRISDAVRQGNPSRNRGMSGNYMLGGMHMSHYGYLPFQIIKRLSCSECGIKTEGQIGGFANDLQNGNIQALEKRLLEIPDEFRGRIRDLSGMDEHFKNEVAKLPWFYNCNRNRYPVWERNNDKRISF